MHESRQHTFLKSLWLFIALLIFSISLSAQNVVINKANCNIDCKYPQNTFEMLFGKLFNTDDAIPQSDKNETKESANVELEEEIDDSQQPSCYTIHFFQYKRSTICLADYKEQYTLQFHPETLPPPPKA